MPKFIEKPKQVIAHQWFPPGHEKHDPSILSEYGYEVGKVYTSWSDLYCVDLGEGETEILPGYWIVESYDYYEGINRYVLLRDAQFKEMYERVTEK